MQYNKSNKLTYINYCNCVLICRFNIFRTHKRCIYGLIEANGFRKWQILPQGGMNSKLSVEQRSVWPQISNTQINNQHALKYAMSKYNWYN